MPQVRIDITRSVSPDPSGSRHVAGAPERPGLRRSPPARPGVKAPTGGSSGGRVHAQRLQRRASERRAGVVVEGRSFLDAEAIRDHDRADTRQHGPCGSSNRWVSQLVPGRHGKDLSCGRQATSGAEARRKENRGTWPARPVGHESRRPVPRRGSAGEGLQHPKSPRRSTELRERAFDSRTGPVLPRATTD